MTWVKTHSKVKKYFYFEYLSIAINTDLVKINTKQIMTSGCNQHNF